MSESIEVCRVVPASAETIYKAWLSGPEHGRMTGTTATYNASDGSFTASDGYISGKTLETVPYSRIVQAWRTTEFSETDPDSTLEILLEPQADGTMVTLRQSNIPVGQGEGYLIGWEEHYFDPMIAYVGSARAKLDQAGHAVSEAAEAVSDAAGKAGQALEAAGEQVQKTANQAARSVKKTAKKAANAAGKAGDAIEAAGEQVQKTADKAARSVKKTAKKAASAVKKFVANAKKKLAARKAAAKKKAAPKKAAPKKKRG